MHQRYEVVIIGAGPAGLSAAIEAASAGMKVVVVDENDKPGGQLFKQIHKFFGSKEHKAKVRGYRIGEMLLEEARRLGVEVILRATVLGIYPNKEISVMKEQQIDHYSANDIVIATGASENMLAFPGWTLPGVIGAGAAQTMMNIHGLMPGQRILMVGSGNVGVVVGYQLLQAGCSLEAVIDASPVIGGYGVHASKIARTGVPFYLQHTITKAHGEDRVTGATITAVDQHWQPIPGSEKTLSVDTICLAVGLSPMSQLAKMAGCEMENVPGKGGLVPVCSDTGLTSCPGIYAVGDVAGIEEASSAMIQGQIAGLEIARARGYLSDEKYSLGLASYRSSLAKLREGQFGHGEQKNSLEKTQEGYPLSQQLMTQGFLSNKELKQYPGVPSQKIRKKGPTAVIECTQNIPCDPCQDACKRGCIIIGDQITKLPTVDQSITCNACGMCVAACPGQAIFLVNENYAESFASVTIPYEFHPMPKKGDKGYALDRQGQLLGMAEVIQVGRGKVFDCTGVLTMKVPQKWAMEARFFRPDEVIEGEEGSNEKKAD